MDRILYPEKISFKDKGKIKIFQKEFITSKKMLKVLQTRKNDTRYKPETIQRNKEHLKSLCG